MRRHRPLAPRIGRAGVMALAAVLALTGLVVAPVAHVLDGGLLGTQTANAAGTFADPFFREVNVFTGLTKPTSVRFDADGRAWVIEKRGVIKEFDSVNDTTATVVADYSADVMDFWDRGMLGLALDPAFTTGSSYLYVFYVWGAEPGDTTQDWGDACPAPPTGPGATTDGCVASTKIDRLHVNLATMQVDDRVNLLWDACQQFPSHSGGGMAFGPDGQLYITFGDGASFTGLDFGQRGGTVPDPSSAITPVNPCLDPVTRTSPDGVTPTVDTKTAQGGQLRAQDVRTTGDPTGVDGTLVRINPVTGNASAGNPLGGSPDPVTRRIVAHGFRNPFRLTVRPGTSEIWVGVVGQNTWESIDRVTVPSSATTTTLPNFGWPCYEGPLVWQSFASLGTDMCASLYATPSAWTAPFYAYAHPDSLDPNGPCYAPVNGVDGGSPTGLAFYEGATGATADYPAKYQGGLFFVDYDRDCLAYFPVDKNGNPIASGMEQVASGIGNPVDLTIGPEGDLYYVDHDNGRVMRIRYLLAPHAAATATPSVARAPTTIHLDASGSTDPDPAASLIAWRWDLNEDGIYDDASGETFDWNTSVAAITHVGLEVESSNGLKDTTTVTVNTATDPPVPVIDTPADGSTFTVGQEISFSGHATDVQDGTIPASGLSWDLVLLHCPADCHEHTVQTFSGVASGSFSAPDHEYPSHLELRLTATDSDGVSTTTSVALQPQTRELTVTSAPTGIQLGVGGNPVTAPATVTVFKDAAVEVSAPLTATIGGARYRFSRWTDSTARIHDVVMGADTSLEATFVPDAPDACSSATSTSSTTAWHADRASGNGDVDWFRFTLPSARRVVVTVGDLPVDARLDLYHTCSTLLATSSHGGTRFEELTASLAAGTYRVKVSFPGDARADAAYVVRFRPMSSGLGVKSARVTTGAGGGGAIRIAGEVLNNRGSTTGQATVTATFRNGSGTVVGTLRASTFARRLANGAVTPFVLAGSVPAYKTISYAVAAGTPGPSRSLTLTALSTSANGNGSVTEQGTVKNTGTTTATSVAVARTWYDDRGEVLDRGVATVSPSTLAPGRSGTFALIRPVLAGVQATRTGLRAS